MILNVVKNQVHNRTSKRLHVYLWRTKKCMYVVGNDQLVSE